MKISLIQSDIIWANIQVNLKRFEILIAQVPTETEIVILPEMFATGFTMQAQDFPVPVGQEVFYWLQKQAEIHQKIIVGSVLTEENGKYYNRMYWMQPNGKYEYYDKQHLFHQAGEDKLMTAGNKRTIISFNGIKFMLQICYDLRFPIGSRNRYDRQNDTFDYDAIIYIANWPEVRKQAYLPLLKARAIENQSYVIWVNRVGVDGNRINHSGNSQIIDAQGNILVEAKAFSEQILSFDLNIASLYAYRKEFKVGLDWD